MVAVHRSVAEETSGCTSVQVKVGPGVQSTGFDLLAATRCHAAVLAQTLNELREVDGKLFHDLHTAVLIRKHSIDRICTRDKDFHQLRFLTVVAPLR